MTWERQAASLERLPPGRPWETPASGAGIALVGNASKIQYL